MRSPKCYRSRRQLAEPADSDELAARAAEEAAQAEEAAAEAVADAAEPDGIRQLTGDLVNGDNRRPDTDN